MLTLSTRRFHLSGGAASSSDLPDPCPRPGRVYTRRLMSSSSRIGLIAALVGLLGCASCESLSRIASLDFVDFPETRVANLEAIHLPSGKHRYTAQLQGDSAYMMSSQGRRVGGLNIGAPRSSAPGEPRKDVLRNPSETCLEILTELLEFDGSKQPRLRAVQIAWCARLIDQDPYVLTRERATVALGELGAGLGIGGPLQLGLAEPRVDAERAGELLKDLLRGYRTSREGLGIADLTDAISAIQGETYDLDGARRMLPAAAALLQGAPEGKPETVAVTELVTWLERRTVELALGRAVLDSKSRVRGAAAAATVHCGDELLYARMMAVLAEEQEGPGLFAFLGVVLERGFPQPSKELNGAEYENATEAWLDALLGIAVQHPESAVGARAMQALARVTEDGPDSLREEDWEAWYLARRGIEADEPAAADASAELP